MARSGAVKQVVSALPLSAGVVRSHVPGETVRDALAAAEALAAEGFDTTIEHLGEEPLDEGQATAAVQAHRVLLDRIADAGLGGRAEVTLPLSAIGLGLEHGERIALENARKICRAAASAGTTVTVDSEDHASTDARLAIVRALREDFPGTGVVLQAHLRRSEADCRSLAHPGSRVRLCKGAPEKPIDAAFADPGEVDRSFVRCLKVLMAGEGHPMVATHDPRLLEITVALASRYGRAPGTYEFQMLHGVRREEQRRLVASGEQVRIHLPYGAEWYPYLVRRLAERPRNLSLFLTSLIPKK